MTFLEELLKGAQGAWQQGFRAPGPKVGRGLFSNPFLTERGRDLRDIQELYDRVHRAHAACWYGDGIPLDLAWDEILARAAADVGLKDPEWALEALRKPVRALLEGELGRPPEIAPDAWESLTLRHLSEIRGDLHRLEPRIRDDRRSYNIVCGAIEDMVAAILAASAEVSSPAVAEGALRFDAALLDVLHEPAVAIETVWSLMFHQALIERELFFDVREQLEYNTLVASGLDPRERDISPKKIVRPTESKRTAPIELVTTYFKHTPIEDLFDAPVPFAIENAVRFEHCHILGGTGHGKSQLLLKLIHHDLTENPEKPSVVVIDSQGDLVRAIARLAIFDPDAAGSLADRLVLIDPTDVEYPASLNLFDVSRERLASYGPADRERLQNGVIETFEHMFSALLGAELTQKQGVIFRFLARLMLQIPDATIHTLREVMEDGRRFKQYMERLEGAARHFFASEFFDPSFTQTKKQIAKRLWGVLANPVFERMFTHPRNKLDLFEAMNAGKIILVNTAKDLLKEEGSAILGRFFVARIAQAAMERATVSENARTPAFVYIDEAQDYLDDSIASLVNQARKYKVGLTFAHQNLDQLSASLRASVTASTSIKFAGGVSAKDARALAEDMHTEAATLQAMRKRRGQTEFACFVKNRTPHALRVSITLGAVQSSPGIDDAAFERLIDANRRVYCEPLSAFVTPPIAPVIEREEAPAREPVAASRPAVPPPAIERPERSDPYLTGQGGKEHKYLQHLIREAAHERGFKADIELEIPGGSVDVAIEGRGVRIACEVSVTTDAEHEAGNVRKCLAAGYQGVMLLVANERRKNALAKSVLAKLEGDERAKVSVLVPVEAVAMLDAIVEAAGTTETTVRGYSVKVKRAALDPDEARRRKEAIAAVVAGSIRGMKD